MMADSKPLSKNSVFEASSITVPSRTGESLKLPQQRKWGFPSGSVVKNLPASAGYAGSNPGNPRRKWQPAPVFLPGKSHGQRSLVGYSPWGRKESARLNTHAQEVGTPN